MRRKPLTNHFLKSISSPALVLCAIAASSSKYSAHADGVWQVAPIKAGKGNSDGIPIAEARSGNRKFDSGNFHINNDWTQMANPNWPIVGGNAATGSDIGTATLWMVFVPSSSTPDAVPPSSVSVIVHVTGSASASSQQASAYTKSVSVNVGGYSGAPAVEVQMDPGHPEHGTSYYSTLDTKYMVRATPATRSNGKYYIHVPVAVDTRASLGGGRYDSDGNPYIGSIDCSYGAESDVATYSLSVDAGGNEGTQTGTTGRYPGIMYWDGTYHDDPNGQIDSNTGQVQQVPNARYLSPSEKHFTTVVSATVTLPSTVVPRSSVTAKARRIRYNNGVIVPAADPVKSVTLNLVTASSNGKPVPHPADGTITYTYRTHDLEDNEQVPYRIPGSADLRVDKWRGRWEFYMDDEMCNRTQLKIDKRSQIWVSAMDYADEESRSPAGLGRVGACDAFVNMIYDNMGIPTLGLGYSAGVVDEGKAALRYFQNKNDVAFQTPPFTSASHVAIQGANVFYGRQEVDSNWNNSGVGPTVRPYDDGVDVPWSPSAFYWDNAISRAPVGELSTTRSLLDELDGE